MSQAFESSYGGDGSKIADDTRLECGICWWVYDPELGDEEEQVAPGTPFRLLPDTWQCPNCAADKSKFMVIGSASVIEDDAVQNLANAYRRAALKVKGLPIYNPTLAVEAVGFREYDGRQAGVIVAPWFMKSLTVLGTAAMFLVGGGILTHGLPALHHAIGHALGDRAAVLQAIGPMLADAVVGVVACAAVLAVVSLVRRLWRGHTRVA
jgi:rubredoxin